MGQKVNPHGLRVGVIKDWDSKWYADDKDFAAYLKEDNDIRKFLKKKLYSSGVSHIEIERAADRVKVTVYTAKPGLLSARAALKSRRQRLNFRNARIRRLSSTLRKSRDRTETLSWLLRISLSSLKTV